MGFTGRPLREVFFSILLRPLEGIQVEWCLEREGLSVSKASGMPRYRGVLGLQHLFLEA